MSMDTARWLIGIGGSLIGLPVVGWITVFAAGKLEYLKQYPLAIIIAWMMVIGGYIMVTIGVSGLTCKLLGVGCFAAALVLAGIEILDFTWNLPGTRIPERTTESSPAAESGRTAASETTPIKPPASEESGFTGTWTGMVTYTTADGVTYRDNYTIVAQKNRTCSVTVRSQDGVREGSGSYSIYDDPWVWGRCFILNAISGFPPHRAFHI